MRILLVEPNYRRESSEYRLRKVQKSSKKLDDGTLWYPPLGLMKLARFHRQRNDEVKFVYGQDPSISQGDLFSEFRVWDRIYISTLFTFDFESIVRTINFYKSAAGGTSSRIYVGGIMSSLMPQDIFNETGIFPVVGLLTSARQIGYNNDDTNIDQLVPDYSLLNNSLYAINDTFYAYTSRGCVNRCAWCGVGKIEPDFHPYVDIKPMINFLRRENGDLSTLRLMDNNVLASPRFSSIVDDLLHLGYGRNDLTNSVSPKHRVVDFNQGLDASFITKSTVKMLSQLSIKPLRIAFDSLSEKRTYLKAIELCADHFPDISNYMLFNFKDDPHDLYERLSMNAELNAQMADKDGKRVSGKIYSYPMRYAPIDEKLGTHANRSRDVIPYIPADKVDWLNSPVWTHRFIRNIEIIKGAAGGAISPTADLAKRAVGFTFQEFLANLYMPEELLRNRNKHEKTVHKFEPKRPRGTGKVEAFRKFITKLLNKQDDRFFIFHNAVSANRVANIREALSKTDDKEIIKWLKLYLLK